MLSEYGGQRISLDSSLPTNSKFGLITENSATDADNDIIINTGKARDFTDSVDINLTSAITKQIDSNWAEGSDAGGFPSSLTLPANGSDHYHVFVIAKDDGTVDAGFDTSISATNLLSDASDYTYYRRVATIYYNSNLLTGIKPYLQIGDEFIIDQENTVSEAFTNANALDGASPTTITSALLPPDIKTLAKIRMGFDEPNTLVNVFSFDANDKQPASAFLGLNVGIGLKSGGGGGLIFKDIITNRSAQYKAWSEASSPNSPMVFLVNSYRDFIDGAR